MLFVTFLISLALASALVQQNKLVNRHGPFPLRATQLKRQKENFIKDLAVAKSRPITFDFDRKEELAALISAGMKHV